MFIIQRCAPGRGFCQTNKSCKDVHQRDVCAWQRCPPSRVVNLAGVSTLQGSLSYRCLYLLEVSTLQGMSTIQRCAPGSGVCQTNKSCRGVHQRGVCLTEMSTFLRCLLYWVIHLTGVSTFKGFLAYRYTVFAPGKGVNITGVSTIQICGSTFQIDLYIWQECPFLKGGWNTVVHLTGCDPFQGCHISHVHLTTGVPIIQSCAPWGMWKWEGCPPCRSVWQTWCQSPPKKVVHLIGLDTHLTRNVCA